MPWRTTFGFRLNSIEVAILRPLQRENFPIIRSGGRNMYQRINGSAWRNIWLVGDLHGCFARLMEALRERRFDPYQDLLLPWAI